MGWKSYKIGRYKHKNAELKSVKIQKYLVKYGSLDGNNVQCLIFVTK